MNYQRIYDYRFRNISEERKMDVWSNIAAHVQTFMPHAKKILDPCAGRCEFANHVKAEEVWAIDREDGFIQSARPGLKTVVADIFETTLPENYFDGIFISNFLEHLDDAEMASRFLRKMYDALAPGGRIVIMGPNFKYCFNEYFDCSDHKLILTHAAVEELLYSEKFALVKSHPQYLPYSFKSRLPVSSALVKIYLKIPLAWKVLGKQFLIIAEKTR